jgi:hypothetical protein
VEGLREALFMEGLREALFVEGLIVNLRNETIKE